MLNNAIHQRALILFIQTSALYKSFTYLLIRQKKTCKIIEND